MADAAVQGRCITGQTVKLACNEVARHAYQPDGSSLLGRLLDGSARHTDEGRAFVRRALEAGWRATVRERDAPFGDYGSRPRKET